MIAGFDWVMSHSHNHSIMGDVGGLVLVAGSWVPTLMANITLQGVFKYGMYAASALLTLLAIVDYIMKIHYKVKEGKRRKTSGHKHDEDLGKVVHHLKELIDEVKRKD